MNEYNTKIGIIDQFIYAVSKMKEYPSLIKQGTGRVLSFAFLMTMLLTSINFVIPLLGYQLSFGGFENFFLHKIPEFTIKNGQMEMDGKLDMNLLGLSVVADSEQEQYTEQDLDENALAQVMISKNNIIIKNIFQVVDIPLKYMSHITINNQSLVKLIPYIYVMELITIGMMLAMEFFNYLVGAIGYACVGLSFVSLRPSLALNFKDLIKIGIYCKVLSAFIGAINEGFGFVIELGYWHTIGMFISFAYLIKAITLYETKKD